MNDLEQLYREEANKCIKGIKAALKKLNKNMYDKQVLFELRRYNHMLRGSSLQMGCYSIAAISEEISDLIQKFIKQLQKGKLKESNVTFATIQILITVLDKAVTAELRGKRAEKRVE